MLTLSDITLRVGNRTLIENSSLQIPDGHKVGLIGRNGAGKSSLLKLITGELHADQGELTIGARRKVGIVAQDAPAGPQTPIDVVLSADLERSSLLEEAETATDANRIAEIHTRLSDIDAHTAQSRAATILSGLGFDNAAQSRPMSDFSGGWRMRVALACALFTRPEILLLDEPTNHLDLEATIWLENYLIHYPNTLIIVSHDREFLNKIPEGIVHLDQQRLTYYSGDYDRFERTRRENQERMAAMAAKQDEQRKHIQAFVDRFRYKASKARQAQSRLKMLEKMEPIATAASDESFLFQFPKPEQLPPPILACEKTAIGYSEDHPILRHLDMTIDMDDRIALLGANGNGKTTLLRMLANRLAPIDGGLRKSSKLRVGYFAQNQLEELDANLTPVQQCATIMKQANDLQIRSHLGAFGFSKDKADIEIARLSGGEKARLALSLICHNKPQILLLDEPTNHLDIDSRQALVQALATFEGAVIIVSHDPHLIKSTADRLWLVADGTCKVFDGDMEDYKRYLLDQNRQAKKGKAQEIAKSDADLDQTAKRKDDRQARAKLREKTAPLRKKLQAQEKQLEKLIRIRDGLNTMLADPDIYQGPAEKVTLLNQELAKVGDEIEEVEMVWLELSEELEALSDG